MNPFPPKLATTLALFGWVSSLTAFDESIPLSRNPRDRCTECDCRIPPGRAGRKCKPCREQESDLAELMELTSKAF